MMTIIFRLTAAYRLWLLARRGREIAIAAERWASTLRALQAAEAEEAARKGVSEK